MCFAEAWLQTSDITKIEKYITLRERIVETMKGEEKRFFNKNRWWVTINALETDYQYLQWSQPISHWCIYNVMKFHIILLVILLRVALAFSFWMRIRFVTVLWSSFVHPLNQNNLMTMRMDPLIWAGQLWFSCIKMFLALRPHSGCCPNTSCNTKCTQTYTCIPIYLLSFYDINNKFFLSIFSYSDY